MLENAMQLSWQDLYPMMLLHKHQSTIWQASVSQLSRDFAFENSWLHKASLSWSAYTYTRTVPQLTAIDVVL